MASTEIERATDRGRTCPLQKKRSADGPRFVWSQKKRGVVCPRKDFR